MLKHSSFILYGDGLISERILQNAILNGFEGLVHCESESELLCPLGLYAPVCYIHLESSDANCREGGPCNLTLTPEIFLNLNLESVQCFPAEFIRYVRPRARRRLNSECNEARRLTAVCFASDTSVINGYEQ
jgi:hypothetical protein